MRRERASKWCSVSTNMLETGGKVELELGCTVNIQGRGLAVSQELSAATMLILVWDVSREERRSGRGGGWGNKQTTSTPGQVVVLLAGCGFVSARSVCDASDDDTILGCRS